MDDISRDLNRYGYTTEVRVRLSETDAVGIVFFGSFGVYMDVGRMDYLNHLGLDTYGGDVQGLAPGAVVAQSVRFRRPARYNDVLVLHVRVAHIGTTSYTFHFYITDKRNRAEVATGKLTLVWLDPTFAPDAVPESFRAAIRAFEGDHLSEG